MIRTQAVAEEEMEARVVLVEMDGLPSFQQVVMVVQPFPQLGPVTNYYSPNRLIMGGGGGAGSTNNGSGTPCWWSGQQWFSRWWFGYYQFIHDYRNRNH